MNVTFAFSAGQRAISRDAQNSFCLFLLAALLTSPLLALSLRAETHANLQSVTATGTSAWSGTYPFTVTGVLLTDPDEMLDSTPHFQPASAGLMGGEWQMVVQAAFPGLRQRFAQEYRRTAALYYQGQSDFDVLVDRIHQHIELM